jgi:DNA-binding Lrp family transcriptional regulator
LAEDVSSVNEVGASDACVSERAAGMLEEGLPIVREPFAEIALRLGLGESRVVEMAREMLRSGRMRRFGPFFDFRRFGLNGYLFGTGGSAEAEANIVSRMNGMKSVTHVYGRKHRLRLWFTALLGSDGEAGEICETFRSEGCEFVAMSVSRMIKLMPSFVSRRENFEPRSAEYDTLPAAVLDEYMLKVARALQKGINISRRPFDAAAALCGMDAEELVEGARRMADVGALRRIGASFDHYRAGWTENSLCAFDMSGMDENIAHEAAFRAVSRLPWVSHCYIRRMYDCEIRGEWPYNLYVMIHASSSKLLYSREAELREKLSVGFIPLRTEIEYKKIYYIL